MVADALSRIQEKRSDQEADELLKDIPILSGSETIVKIYEEERGDHGLESPAQYTMLSAAMKAVFDNLTSGAGRRAKLEYDTHSPIRDEADSIEISVKSAQVSNQMHVTDWSEAQWEDPKLKAAIDWCQLDRKKSKLWAQQLSKFKSRLGSNWTTVASRSLLRNADRLTLSGVLLYH